MSNSGVFDVNDIRYLMDYQQWPTPGELQLIQTQTVTPNVAAVDFTNIQENTYNVHFLTCDNVQAVSDGPILEIQFYENGTLETASVYDYARQYGNSAGTFGEDRSSSSDGIEFLPNTGGSTNETSQGYAYFYNLGDATKYSFSTLHSVAMNANPYLLMQFGGGVLPQASKVDGIRLKFSSGNIDTGTYSLYGIRFA